jgi:hypothetical protein
MWLFQLRRGIVELENKGLGQVNSPLKLTKDADDLIQPLVPELRQFYLAINGDQLGLVELAVELERQFGPRLVDEVCKKVNISDAACLVLAIGQLRPVGPAALREAKELCLGTPLRELMPNRPPTPLPALKIRDLEALKDPKGGRWFTKK